MRHLARVICCAALLVFAAGICQAASTQTGATLEIRGTVSSGNHSQNVDLFVNDADIHCVSSYYGPCGNPSPCDGIFSDSYVLQGGSPTGCDNEGEGTSSPFETSQNPGQITLSFEGVVSYRFDITTSYSSEGCNSARTICANPDTGFLTVSNNGGSTFTGSITLSGSSSGCGTVFDTFNGTLAPPDGSRQSVTLVLPTGPAPYPGSPRPSDSSGCGGFNSTVTVGPKVNVRANGGTFTLLSGGPLTQSITIPVGTTLGHIAAMRDVLRLVDGAACDPTVAGGNPGAPNFFGGSAVAGPPGANPRCLRVKDDAAGIITNQCFDSSGNQLTDCSDMNWNGTNLIGLDSLYSNSVDPQNPAYVIAHDDPGHQQLLPPPLGPDWTDISTRFQTGCTTPPCGGGGGGKRLNGQETVIDLHLTCQVFTFSISPATVQPGSWIKVSGALKGCAATKTLGLFTFTFEGPMKNDSGCTPGGRVTIPPPPPPGGKQGGFKVTLPPSGVNVPFSFYLPVPDNACTGLYKFTTTILSGGFFYNPNASFTVQQ